MEEVKRLIEFFAKEGQVILQAPATFALCAVIIAGIIWAVFSFHYSGQIENLNTQIKTTSESYEARIKLKDDQLADYKSKLGGASPQEANPFYS
jgi:hypothetical protein